MKHDDDALTQALQEARAQARRYQQAFVLSATGQALVGLDGRFIEVNPSLCAMLGYPAETLLQRRFQDITHPDDVGHDAQAAQELIRGTRSHFRREKRYLRPDGQTVWALVTSCLVRDEHDQPSHFATVIEDITERKAADQGLREREALLSSMGKFVPGLIHKIGFDAAGRARFLYISDRAMEMFELPHEQMARDYYAHHIRVHPDDLAYARRLATAPPPGAVLKPVDFEYRVILPSRGLRVYGGHAIPVTEADGSIVWYGHTADVTDKKALAEAKLAARVAQDANQAKSDFLSRVSHELRTPLNAVIGFAQLLRLDPKGGLSEAQHKKVQLIEDAGSHLLGIISDVLDLSRIEAGNLPLSPQPTTPLTVLQEALYLVEGLASDKAIRLLPPQAEPHLPVWADPMRLRQVLVNLLSNAVKYNRPHGEVQVRIWQQDHHVAISVSDTGQGLSAEQLQRLFQPFDRLGAEHSGIEGTGIGLVIVRKLLEAMQGRLDVNSTPGVGSRFTAWLPVGQAQPERIVTAETALVTSSASHAPPPQPPKMTVLYAEDNEINAELVRNVLSLRPACHLVVAPDGAAALAQAQAAPPDLLLLDMHLGDMTGFELAEALDRIPGLQAIPKVAFSADAMPDQIHRAQAAGFASYLTKPLDVQALLQCIDTHLARVGAR